MTICLPLQHVRDNSRFMISCVVGQLFHGCFQIRKKAIRVTQALDRLINLYTAWDKPEEAAKWQAILDTAKAATEKARE